MVRESLILLNKFSSAVYVLDCPGRFGNQVWSYLPYFLYAEKTERIVVIFGFNQYIEYFPRLRSIRNLYIIHSKLISKIVNKCFTCRG